MRFFVNPCTADISPPPFFLRRFDPSRKMSQPHGAEIWAVVLRNRLDALRESIGNETMAPLFINEYDTKAEGRTTFRESPSRKQSMRLASTLCKLEACCRFFRSGTPESYECWKFLAANPGEFMGFRRVVGKEGRAGAWLGEWSVSMNTSLLLVQPPCDDYESSMWIQGYRRELDWRTGGRISKWRTVICRCAEEDLPSGWSVEERTRHRKLAVAFALNPLCNDRVSRKKPDGKDCLRIFSGEIQRQISAVSALANIDHRRYLRWHERLLRSKCGFWNDIEENYRNFERTLALEREHPFPIKGTEKRSFGGNCKDEGDVERPAKRGKKRRRSQKTSGAQKKKGVRTDK